MNYWEFFNEILKMLLAREKLSCPKISLYLMKKKTNKQLQHFDCTVKTTWVLQDPYFLKSNQGDYSYSDGVGPTGPILFKETKTWLSS